LLETGKAFSSNATPSDPKHIEEPFKVEEAETVKVKPPSPEKVMLLWKMRLVCLLCSWNVFSCSIWILFVEIILLKSVKLSMFTLFLSMCSMFLCFIRPICQWIMFLNNRYAMTLIVNLVVNQLSMLAHEKTKGFY